MCLGTVSCWTVTGTESLLLTFCAVWEVSPKCEHGFHCKDKLCSCCTGWLLPPAAPRASLGSELIQLHISVLCRHLQIAGGCLCTEEHPNLSRLSMSQSQVADYSSRLKFHHLSLAQPEEEHLSSSLKSFTRLLTLSGFSLALAEQPVFLRQVDSRHWGQCLNSLIISECE